MSYIITVTVENEDDRWTVEELIEQVDEAGGFEEAVTIKSEEIA